MKDKLQSGLKFFTAAVLLFFVGLLFSNSVSAQNCQTALLIAPWQETFIVGQSFSAKVILKPGDLAVDKVKADVVFPKKLLEIQDIRHPDYLQIEISDILQGNETGVIHFDINIEDGFREDGELVMIDFLVKSAGGAQVTIAKPVIISEGHEAPVLTQPSEYRLKGGEVATPNSLKEENFEFVSEGGEETMEGITIVNTISADSILVGRPPVLKGIVSVPFAKVTAMVDNGLLVGKAVADSVGKWTWSMPDDLLPISYQVRLRATDPSDEKNVDIDWQEVSYVIDDVSRYLHDFTMSSGMDTIKPGDKFVFSLEFANFEDVIKKVESGYVVEYFVESSDKAVLFSDILNVDEVIASVGVKKEVLFPDDLDPGGYRIVAQLTLDDELINEHALNLKVVDVNEPNASRYITIGLLTLIFFVVVVGVIRIKRK